MIKKRNFWTYLIFQIITFGIYGLFFWYGWTKDVNKVCDGDDEDSANFVLVLLLDIFSFGIYIWVWNYKMAERLYQRAPSYGAEVKHGGLFIILLKFIYPIGTFVSDAFRIKYLNELAAGYNNVNGTAPKEAPAETAAPAVAE